jgi:hypothetical protein
VGCCRRIWRFRIFGNPFRPGRINPTWQIPTVVSLAQAAYDNRNLPAGALDPIRLAILADALEDTGCCCSYRLLEPLVHVADADAFHQLTGPTGVVSRSDRSRELLIRAVDADLLTEFTVFNNYPDFQGGCPLLK